MKFEEELRALKASPPSFVTSVDYSPEKLLLTIGTSLPAPRNFATVSLSKQYIEKYPSGEVHFLVGHTFNSVSVGMKCSLRQLCHAVHEVASLDAGPPVLADGAGIGSPSSSTEWIMEPTVELGGSPNSTGGGGFFSQMSPDLLVAYANVHAAMVDHPTIHQCDVTLTMDLPNAVSDAMLASLHVVPREKVQVRLRLHREMFLDAHVDVTVGQEQQFKTSDFFGLSGQLRCIAQRFCDVITLLRTDQVPSEAAALMLEGFSEADITNAMSSQAGNRDLVSLRKLLVAANGGPPVPLPSNLLDPVAFFATLREYLASRISEIQDHCVICDRRHETPGMLGCTVCLRETCWFQFHKLHVAKDITDSTAVQTGVVDLLINFAKAAAASSKHHLVFKPFPTIFSASGSEVMSERRPDIEKAREVLRKIPETKTLVAGGIQSALRAAHPLAGSMFTWILASCRSVLVKLSQDSLLPFMGTPHQFALVTSNDEHLKRFEALKAKHGALWAFHGSNIANWHSILRNGLKNMSGTPLMANGAAYGSGIYLSPAADVSFDYSQISKSDSAGRQAPAGEDEFVELESLHCIAICEVTKNDLRMSGNIWVAPHEDAVVTRFFVVFTRGLSSGCKTELGNLAVTTILNELAAKTFTRPQ